VGLCASENLADESKVYGGANHVSIGEMAMNELYYRRICEKLDGMDLNADELVGKRLEICVARGNVSKAVGQNRRNKTKLCEKYRFADVKVLEKSEVSGYNIIISF
jgi:hypothetical protein